MGSAEKLAGAHLHISVHISTGPLQLPLRLEPKRRSGDVLNAGAASAGTVKAADTRCLSVLETMAGSLGGAEFS